MPSVSELLERESVTVDLERGHFERLLRRRDRKRRNQRIGAGAIAIIIALVSLAAVARAFRTAETPVDEPPGPLHTGMVITFTGDDPRGSGDLVAQDPNTGEVRTLVDGGPLIYEAAMSADGRWVAFEVASGCGGDADLGVWVTNGLDEPRQLTRPCFEDPDVPSYGEVLLEWSPVGAKFAVTRNSIDGDVLVLIDAATGDLTDLGAAAGNVTALAWSPDGNRIGYGARGSVYSVDVGSGDHSLLASSLGQVSGGETGSGIRWSPDGARIAVLTEAAENRLYLMNADGSDLDLITEGVVIAHILGSPGLVWSPDGTRMAYATFSGERDELRIWNGSPDASTPVLVFESPPASDAGIWHSGGPVWSPDGTRIAFRYSPTEDEEEPVWLVANADGTGDVQEIDELRYLSWRGGWYFCECYG